jgi:hypothetical protein
MPIRRSAQLEDRRRRVLNESLVREDGVRATGVWGGEGLLGRSRNYGDAEFLDDLPRVTELIPVHWAKTAGLAASGVGAIALLVALHAWALRFAERLGGALPEALDLSARGSLAAWLSSMVLAAAGLAALVILSVRRHKRDDYHGVYRIWLWGAICCFLSSVDAATGLHRVFAHAATAATGTALHGDGALWWIAVWGFVFGGIGVRLLVDMRRCRPATVALVTAACCYAAVLADGFVSLPALAEWPLQRALGVGGLLLGGHWLVLVSLVLYARHVLLDAMGLLPYDVSEDEEEDDDANDASLGSGVFHPVTVHPPHGVPRPTALPAAVPVAQAPAPAPSWQATAAYLADPTSAPPPSAATISYGKGGVGASATPPVGRKLTKEEKKRLREKLERSRRERESRGY